MINLGDRVRDILTGFSGIAVSRYEHLFNAPEIKIQPENLTDAGVPADAIWFEEARVEAQEGTQKGGPPGHPSRGSTA